VERGGERKERGSGKGGREEREGERKERGHGEQGSLKGEE